MTKFLVTGQADLWHVFWVLATWSAAYMIAAVILREKFGEPQTLFEKYWLWFGRIVGVVGALMIFAYGYRATGELERVEQEVEQYKEALAARQATGVGDYSPVTYLREAEHNGFKVSWESECTDGRSRPMFSAGRCSTTGDAGITAKSGSVHRVPRSESGAATDGTAAVY